MSDIQVIEEGTSVNTVPEDVPFEVRSAGHVAANREKVVDLHKASAGRRGRGRPAGQRTPADPDDDPKSASVEYRYTEARLTDPDLRVGGPTGDADGRIDRTIYRWIAEDNGAAYWHITDPTLMEADAQGWMRANAKNKYCDRVARSCAATLNTQLIQSGRDKWVPQANPKLNLIPLRGQYLSIADDGTITCLEPDPELGVTYCVGAQFDATKVVDGVYHPAPVDPQGWFGRYLTTTFVDDGVRDLAQEALATVLINRCFEKSIWLYGPGENGKSVLLHVMTAVVGGRAAPIKLARLVRDHFGTAALHGARLATVAEVPKALTNEMQDTLKELISWDAQPLERKGRDAFTFRPFAVWVLASNAFPRVSQHEHGFWRKILTLPFTQRVDPANKIQDFHKLIVEDSREMAQVLDWLLAGAQRLIKRGGKFPELPQAVADLAQQQRLESDPVVAFLDDAEAMESTMHWTSKMSIYQAYTEYCDERRKNPLGEPAFWASMRTHFPAVDLNGKKGPALSKNKARERYVPLNLAGVDALPIERVPKGWSEAVDLAIARANHEPIF
jgi:P4 family phage/plasmid primase-like protien